MKRKLIIIVVLALTLIAAVWMLYPRLFPEEFERRLSARTMKILNTGERFVCFSLDPARPKTNSPPSDTFHDYTILGRIEIPSQEGRAELLLNALYKGIKDSDGTVYKCFEPRHGISATLAGETVDLVICFECGQIVVYEKKDVKAVIISRSPLPTFNQVLKLEGLPIAKDK